MRLCVCSWGKGGCVFVARVREVVFVARVREVVCL